MVGGVGVSINKVDSKAHFISLHFTSVNRCTLVFQSPYRKTFRYTQRTNCQQAAGVLARPPPAHKHRLENALCRSQCAGAWMYATVFISSSCQYKIILKEEKRRRIMTQLAFHTVGQTPMLKNPISHLHHGLRFDLSIQMQNQGFGQQMSSC